MIVVYFYITVERYLTLRVAYMIKYVYIMQCSFIEILDLNPICFKETPLKNVRQVVKF